MFEDSISKKKLFLSLSVISVWCYFLHKLLDLRPCYSPLETVRRFNFLPLLTAPFVPPNLKSFGFYVFSLLSLTLYFSKFNVPINHNLLSFLAQSYTSSVILSLLSSSILFYLLPTISTKSLWISHFFNDCSSGLFHFTLPAAVFLISKKQLPCDLYITATILFNIFSIVFSPQNYIAVILSLISATAVIFTKNRKPKRDAENNLPNNFRKSKNIKRPTSRLFAVLIGAIFATVLVHEVSRNWKETDAVSEASPNLTIVINTISRKENPRYLSNTLESLLQEFPHMLNQAENWHIYPISYDTGQVVFQGLEAMMNQNNVSRNYITFVQGEDALKTINTELINQSVNFKVRVHVAASLKYATEKSSPNTWIMVHEDDFELCQGKWEWFIHSLRQINQQSESPYCGFFVATGGAGIAIRPDIVPSIINALLDRALREPADMIMQNCLRGRYRDHCQDCHKGKGKLLVSSHLIFRHIGFISSLDHPYDEAEGRWPCGWRHPFNGDPDVDVIHTDTFS